MSLYCYCWCLNVLYVFFPSHCGIHACQVLNHGERSIHKPSITYPRYQEHVSTRSQLARLANIQSTCISRPVTKHKEASSVDIPEYPRNDFKSYQPSLCEGTHLEIVQSLCILGFMQDGVWYIVTAGGSHLQ